MNSSIHISYDDTMKGYVIKMPETASLEDIESWRNEFSTELKSLTSNQKFVILIDTNRHDFESIQCLKSIREFLTDNENIKSKCMKVGFVQPEKYMEPHIKSEYEGYFESFDDAYTWLKR